MTAVARWFRATSERIKTDHTEAGYQAIAEHVPRGARVLDIGAWDCRLVDLLRERRGCDVIGADLVDKRERDVPFAPITDGVVPVADGSRDVVMLLYVLHHAADDLALLREARRVVAPGGVVLIAEDQVETWWQRFVTVAFHVWLLLFTFMGWRGQFRRQAAWRERFASVGLQVETVRDLGAQRRWFPRNLLFILRSSEPALPPIQPTGRSSRKNGA